MRGLAIDFASSLMMAGASDVCSAAAVEGLKLELSTHRRGGASNSEENTTQLTAAYTAIDLHTHPAISVQHRPHT